MFGEGKTEKAIYMLAFTILISAIISSFSLIYSANVIANSGMGFGALTGGTVADPTQGTTDPSQGQTAPPTPPPPPTNVEFGSLPAKGDPDAPVKIVEFSDFQCPFCGRWFDQTFPTLQPYIDRGDVVLYFRDFPLSFHPEAEPAAIAARCANEQGKYWEFHDLIFQNQGSLGDSQYKQWAADLGLNTNQFNQCVDSDKYQAEVRADFAAGQQAGISGTPSFFINGNKIVGAQPASVFEAAIQAELA